MYLGVKIDSKLKFNLHLQLLKDKLSRLAGISWKLADSFNFSTAINFYYVFAYSTICYGVTSWGGVLLTKKCNGIKNMFNKIILNLFRPHYVDKSLNEMLIDLNLLKFDDIVKVEMLSAYYSNLCSGTLGSLNFEPKISSYRTRNNELGDLSIPTPRTETVKANYSYQIPVLWNELPHEVRIIQPITAFRYNIKKHFISKY